MAQVYAAPPQGGLLIFLILFHKVYFTDIKKYLIYHDKI